MQFAMSACVYAAVFKSDDDEPWRMKRTRTMMRTTLGKGEILRLLFFCKWVVDGCAHFVFVHFSMPKQTTMFIRLVFLLLVIVLPSVHVCVCVFRAAAARLLLVKVTTHTTVVFFFFGRRSLPCVSLLFFFSLIPLLRRVSRPVSSHL